MFKTLFIIRNLHKFKRKKISQIESSLVLLMMLKTKILAGTFQNSDFIDRNNYWYPGRAELVVEYLYSYGPWWWMFLFVGVPQWVGSSGWVWWLQGLAAHLRALQGEEISNWGHGRKSHRRKVQGKWSFALRSIYLSILNISLEHVNIHLQCCQILLE